MKRRSAARRGPGLRVADASVADRHAIIRYARGRHYVVDLKSAGGTFVNGRRIRRKQELKHGDNIRFGVAAPYRFIDPDALKRRRERRILRAGAVIAASCRRRIGRSLWEMGPVFPATVTEIVAWANSRATSKRVDAPTTGVASAPTPPRLHRHAQRLSAVSCGLCRHFSVMAPSLPTPNIPASLPTVKIVRVVADYTWLERINFFRSGSGSIRFARIPG